MPELKENYIKCKMLDGVQVRVGEIQRVVSKPLLHCLGCVLSILLLLECESELFVACVRLLLNTLSLPLKVASHSMMQHDAKTIPMVSPGDEPCLGFSKYDAKDKRFNLGLIRESVKGAGSLDTSLNQRQGIKIKETGS